MKKAKVLSFKYILYDFIRITGSPGLLWYRPKKLYLSDKAKKKIKGGALMISNHIGMVDPMYLLLAIWYRRHHFIATKELFQSNFTRELFKKAFCCIEIDRENFGIGTFKEIIEHLKAGELVSMFPEGKVNLEKQGLQSFKSGMTLMALKSGVPLIPVYIRRRKNFFDRLIVGIGDPVYIEGFASGGVVTLADLDRATKYLHEQEELLEKMCLEYKSKKGENK